MSCHFLFKKFLSNTQSEPTLSLKPSPLFLRIAKCSSKHSLSIYFAGSLSGTWRLQLGHLESFSRLNSPSSLSLSSLSSMDISLILSPVWLRHPCPAFPLAELSPKFELWLLVDFFPGVNHSTTSESPSLFFAFILHLCLFSQSYSLNILRNITKELI